MPWSRQRWALYSLSIKNGRSALNFMYQQISQKFEIHINLNLKFSLVIEKSIDAYNLDSLKPLIFLLLILCRLVCSKSL